MGGTDNLERQLAVSRGRLRNSTAPRTSKTLLHRRLTGPGPHDAGPWAIARWLRLDKG